MIDPEVLSSLLRDRLMRFNDLALVAEFTDSTIGTVKQWLNGRPVKGQRQNSLWHLLAAAGLDSPELEAIPPFGRYLGTLLAYRIITIEDAQEICDVRNGNAVLDAVRGNRTPSGPKFTLSELTDMYGELLQSAEAALRARLGTAMKVTITEPTEVVRPDHQPEPELRGDAGRIQFLLASARTLSEIMPLLRYLLSDECTAEERARLREFMGPEEMFAMSTLLNGLCGERARSQVR
jgi:hypothetical protein